MIRCIPATGEWYDLPCQEEPPISPRAERFSFGWICPSCRRIYSPSVTECEHCRPPVITVNVTSGVVNIQDARVLLREDDSAYNAQKPREYYGRLESHDPEGIVSKRCE